MQQFNNIQFDSNRFFTKNIGEYNGILNLVQWKDRLNKRFYSQRCLPCSISK